MAKCALKLLPLFVVLALGVCKADSDESSGTGTDADGEDAGDDGDGGDDGGGGGGGGGACVPGQSIACACPNGDTGAQICNDDGASYGPCVCEGDDGGGDGGTGDDGGTGTGGGSGTGGGGLPNGAPCDTGDECESGYCWSDWNYEQQEPFPEVCKPECLPDWVDEANCDEHQDCCSGNCIMEGQEAGYCRGG
jgi:hypothetical protein